LVTGGSVHRAVVVVAGNNLAGGELLLRGIEPRYASIDCRFDLDRLMSSF
jgi:hypothetical protein